MDNHNQSKKHAENVSRLLLELDDDYDESDQEYKDDDDDKLNAADADDVELADNLPDMSQSR